MKCLKFEYLNDNGERHIKQVEPLKIFYDPRINKGSWMLEAIDREDNVPHSFVMERIQRVIDEKVQRFLCATVYVINDKRELLVLHHKKFNKWCPPGGKVDNNETPDEAAVRECYEETGIQVKLVGSKSPFASSLLTPIGSQCNVVKEGVRHHVDLIYMATPLPQQTIKLSEREAFEVKWVSLNELKTMDTFEDVPYWFQRCLDKLAQ